MSTISKTKTNYLIYELSLGKSYVEVKENFERFFNEKIKGEEILKIEEEYKNQIDLFKLREMTKVISSGHEERIRQIQKGLAECEKSQLLKAIKVGKNEDGSEEIIPEYGMDRENHQKYIKLWREEEISIKKLILEHAKIQAFIKNMQRANGDEFNSGNELTFKPVQISIGMNEEAEDTNSG